MARAGYQHDSAMLQFPQPSRPPNIDGGLNMLGVTTPYQFSEEGYQEIDDNQAPGPSGEGEQFLSDDDLLHILGQIEREHDDGSSNDHEIVSKIISKVKKEVHFDTLKKIYRQVNRTPADRGVSIGDTMEHKLERFKVKNVNLGGGGVVHKETKT